ncbi:phage tail protein [Fibrobacter sp.]|uniref:phage tail protein n=1 Tax=Fibrobacter sp. TaxID=35828 RepID=UPI00386320CA
MPDVEWPLPVVFHFSVKLGNSEISFSEVSGLETSIETKEVHSGGDNSTVYYLPDKIKYTELVLKRAVLKKSDSFFTWCLDCMNSMTNAFMITPKPIEVSLLNAENEPLATWTFNNAYPVKWSFSTLDAMKGEVMIETLSFKYQNMKRTK